MKKSLAKKITLSILAGAVLMSSSVAWAEKQIGITYDTRNNVGGFTIADINGKYSVYIGVNSEASGDNAIAIGSDEKTSTKASSTDSIAIGRGAWVKTTDTYGIGSIAIGARAEANGNHNVALGSGSIADSETDRYVVSVGAGGDRNGGVTNIDDRWVPSTRSIINVTDIVRAVHGVNATQKFSDLTDEQKEEYGSYVVNLNTLSDALSGYYTKTDIETMIGSGVNSGDFVKKEEISGGTETKLSDNFVVTDVTGGTTTSVTINSTDDDRIVMDKDGITVGANSTRMDSTGFYAGGAKPHNYANSMAAITEDGKIKGAGGKFEVGTDGSVKAADGAFKVDANGNVTAEKITAKEVKAENLYTKAEIDKKLGGSNASVAGINQRLEKTNAKINKVGAGAAALAALHPLDYDPDDKLTFSAGMGNYAGENAAALGAFYRPNEKFMLSLGGTMGNGENMVNLGLSIGLDKPNGFAKLSKRELIQKVNVMEAKYEQVEAENEAMKAEMAEMKAMLQELLAKK